MRALFRIASSEAKLRRGPFFAWGLRPPSSAVYEDHSVVRTGPDGRQGKYGHARVRFTWDEISDREIATLRRIKTSLTDDLVYLTIPDTGGNIIDVSGRMPAIVISPPRYGNLESGGSVTNFSLVVENCTVVNNPYIP